MKKILILVSVLLSNTLYAQDTPVQLSDCIRLALANKANIQATKTDVIIANLQQQEARNKHIPQISLAYEYRYNPIIASQVIPIGQFGSTPTDEMRVVQFGTKWQQTAGIDLIQPLVDLSIKSKIAESKINEKVKQADLQIVEDELKYEVLQSFSKILVYTQQMESAIVDTARTYKSYELIKNRFDERRVLKTDVNKASLNHNNALSSYKIAFSELLKEKIYLSFLTSLSITHLLDNKFDFSPLLSNSFLSTIESINMESVASVKQLDFKESLLEQQVKTERNKYRPTINFVGYLGSNQYADRFDPTMSNSWFGNNYIGLSLKLPLLGENTNNKIKQLKTQSTGIEHSRNETINKLRKDFWQTNQDIEKYKEQIILTQSNVELMIENVAIFQERLSSGQYNASDLNLQELDLLKEKTNLLKQQAELINKEIERLNFSGNLNEFIDRLNRNNIDN